MAVRRQPDASYGCHDWSAHTRYTYCSSHSDVDQVQPPLNPKQATFKFKLGGNQLRRPLSIAAPITWPGRQMLKGMIKLFKEDKGFGFIKLA